MSRVGAVSTLPSLVAEFLLVRMLEWNSPVNCLVFAGDWKIGTVIRIVAHDDSKYSYLENMIEILSLSSNPAPIVQSSFYESDWSFHPVLAFNRHSILLLVSQ